MRKLGVGLYGSNGHQIGGHLASHPRAQVVAVAAMSAPASADVARHESLKDLLADARVEVVSLCSPRRAEQAAHAVAALEAGKHVYAEKPAAFTEADLDRILAASRANGRRFHEMAGTVLTQPYRAMREVVRSGVIGTVVQVTAQKSYPMNGNRRPQDEDVDGGLVMQCTVHATRMVEQVSGQRIVSVEAIDTKLGSPGVGELRIATAMTLRLEGGAIASVMGNYLNPMGTGIWGYEDLRLFGTAGMLESTDGGRRTRLVVGDKDLGPIDTSAPSLDYFDCMIDEILDGKPMPFDLEEELHPTRVVIRARADTYRARVAQKP